MTRSEHWRGRRVFVTGATGFLGSHLVAALVGRGAEVSILRRRERPPTAISAAWIDRVRVINGTVEDPAVLGQALLGIQTVFHLAAQPLVEVAHARPAETFRVNLEGTWNLLEAARVTGTVDQFLFASTDKAYGLQATLPYTEELPLLPSHPYDVSKACGEALVKTYAHSYGLPVAITRCANLYGPGDQNFGRLVPGALRSVLAGEPPELRSDGSFTRDYLYVKDGALAYLCLAEALAADPSLSGEVFNFSAETPLSVLAMLERLQRHAGTAFAPRMSGGATGEIVAQSMSSAKARERLGWAPAYDFDDALEETVAYYRDVLS